MLVSIFKYHNKNFEELVGKEYAASTLTRYETSLQHTINFMQWKYKVSDMDIHAVNHQFLVDYEF